MLPAPEPALTGVLTPSSMVARRAWAARPADRCGHRSKQLGAGGTALVNDRGGHHSAYTAAEGARPPARGLPSVSKAEHSRIVSCPCRQPPQGPGKHRHGRAGGATPPLSARGLTRLPARPSPWPLPVSESMKRLEADRLTQGPGLVPATGAPRLQVARAGSTSSPWSHPGNLT